MIDERAVFSFFADRRGASAAVTAVAVVSFDDGEFAAGKTFDLAVLAGRRLRGELALRFPALFLLLVNPL